MSAHEQLLPVVRNALEYRHIAQTAVSERARARAEHRLSVIIELMTERARRQYERTLS